jgi:hypothetical protein
VFAQLAGCIRSGISIQRIGFTQIAALAAIRPIHLDDLNALTPQMPGQTRAIRASAFNPRPHTTARTWASKSVRGATGQLSPCSCPPISYFVGDELGGEPHLLGYEDRAGRRVIFGVVVTLDSADDRGECRAVGGYRRDCQLRSHGRARASARRGAMERDPSYRRRIGRQLNKGESLHALRCDLHYAQQGTIATPHLTDQTEQAWCLTVLTNAVITWRPSTTSWP